MLPVWLLCALLGCSPSSYRQQADAETYGVLQQRTALPNLDLGPRPVEAAAASRLADPYPADSPPKPPDDATAALFMLKPGGLSGAKSWNRYGLAPGIEPETWPASLELDAKGTLQLTQTRAVELALLHSREYQLAVEDVYLSALGLTLNRFDFASQWLGGFGSTYTRVGASSLPDESNTLSATGNLGVRRNLAAGGQLLVDFANSFVWEFTGKSHTVTGSLGATLIQPLLRNFGREVRLEVLTQAERDTLYAVRDFARFRKQFWANTAIQNGGYLDLLLQLQAVRNARQNLLAQEQNYQLTLDQYRGGKLSAAALDQTLQGLLSARQDILDTDIGLQNALDAYKLRLGLPPRLPVELDDEFLKPFVLTAPELEALQDKLALFKQARNKEFGKFPEAEVIRAGFDELLTSLDAAEKQLATVEGDVAAWKVQIEKPAKPGDDAESRDRAQESFAIQDKSLAKARDELKARRKKIEEHRKALTGATRPESWAALVEDGRKLTEFVDDLANAQNLARIYVKLDLPQIALEEAEAIDFAKQNRLDFQNRLAQVTDSWRRVLIAANQLQSDFTVRASYNLLTQPDTRNPFDFSNDASRLSLGFQFDGPLNRQAERNAYRAAQIAYQRARRGYMELSDGIERDVRLRLRSLKQQRTSFEIARLSLIAAARQVATERALQVKPVQEPNAASRDATLSTLQALGNLNASRNRLAASYIQYEQARIQLLLDLEALQLDERGFPTNANRFTLPGSSAAPTTGPGRP